MVLSPDGQEDSKNPNATPDRHTHEETAQAAGAEGTFFFFFSLSAMSSTRDS